MSKLNALHNDCYFDLRYNGVKFKNYVGVFQVDDLTIEILPKIDSQEKDKKLWHDVLISMLKVTKKLNVQKVGNANVSKQNLHLLDIYFDWFLDEVEKLIHLGLIKQYNRETGNVKALKGKLEFAGHLRKNLIHKERFYTTHQVYNKDHLIHQILGYALAIIENFSKGSSIYSRCKSVQLDFPEVKQVSIDHRTFSRLKLNRKTSAYKTALEIARFIILQYAPNIKHGQESMIALLFDMNSLWEEFILNRIKYSARKSEDHIEVYGQRSKRFWQNVTIRPDIVVRKNEKITIIDTKWKNIGSSKPSTQDLRQMFVYNEYWDSSESILLYPTPDQSNAPNFSSYKNIEHSCGIGKLNIINDGKLNLEVGNEIIDWIKDR
ncbi:McrC family protein [Zunongwangia endophytica]|uniref:McrC family protein n=1 Tax=Zunongwangia endophytica TaxID=1808945 RepID=A0ABV8HB81_9FLAO|nr:restriction endonuclease [Zunongwangia endophytica]MDN3594645.1 restriction endonuclease [Zunongwangia endophytica]